MTDYYVKNGGNDSLDGLSDGNAWETLDKVYSVSLSPGDNIYLKRGSTFNEDLIINDAGSSGSPITYSAYGTGNAPVLSYDGTKTVGVKIYTDMAYNTLENLKITTATSTGVAIYSGADYCIIQDCEFDDVGIAVGISAAHCLITRNYIHDLKIVVNTPTPTTDDYGALGVQCKGQYNEISYNTFVNCYDTSYDFGEDGGAIEFTNTSSYSSFHHNYVETCDGVLQVGGTEGGHTATDLEVYHNVCVNNGKFSTLQLTGEFAITVSNFMAHNNTIISDGDVNPHTRIFNFGGTPSGASVFVAKNNILYINNIAQIWDSSIATHTHNLYHMTGTTTLGLTADGTEIIDNPDFVDFGGEDYHLSSSSPAINTGTDLGYTEDYDDNPIDASPDIGAYEYQPAAAPQPAGIKRVMVLL